MEEARAPQHKSIEQRGSLTYYLFVQLQVAYYEVVSKVQTAGSICSFESLLLPMSGAVICQRSSLLIWEVNEWCIIIGQGSSLLGIKEWSRRDGRFLYEIPCRCHRKFKLSGIRVALNPWHHTSSKRECVVLFPLFVSRCEWCRSSKPRALFRCVERYLHHMKSPVRVIKSSSCPRSRSSQYFFEKVMDGFSILLEVAS